MAANSLIYPFAAVCGVLLIFDAAATHMRLIK
jgi:hypothetical protein